MAADTKLPELAPSAQAVAALSFNPMADPFGPGVIRAVMGNSEPIVERNLTSLLAFMERHGQTRARVV